MALRMAAIAAVVVCSFANGPAVASTWLSPWLDNLINSGHPATPAAQASNKRVATIADKRAERGRTATCLPSPGEVRKLQPKAWPKWTYGPNGERCWYAGKKPVFAKARRSLPSRRSFARQAASRHNPPAHTSAPQPATNATRVWDHHNGDPVWQPWVVEHRWDESLRYLDLNAEELVSLQWILR
jgi:hypothetical protein